MCAFQSPGNWAGELVYHTPPPLEWFSGARLAVSVLELSVCVYVSTTSDSHGKTGRWT